MKYPWINIAQQLQSIAQAGLTFAENKYDIERYHQLMDLSKKIYSEFTDADFDKLSGIFDAEEGYLTPKVDVRGVVFRNDRILMVKETIDDRWSIPGGWADVGFTPKEIAEKEVYEEAGIKVKAGKLMAVLDKKCHSHPPDVNYVYKIFIHCEEVTSDIKPGMETSEVDFFGLNELPQLSTPRNTKEQIEMLFDMVHSTNYNPIID